MLAIRRKGILYTSYDKRSQGRGWDKLSVNDLEVVHSMDRFGGENNERMDIFIQAKSWKGEPANKEPNKCDDMQWFDMDSMPENIIPYVKQAIDCIKNKIPYSEHGY